MKQKYNLKSLVRLLIGQNNYLDVLLSDDIFLQFKKGRNDCLSVVECALYLLNGEAWSSGFLFGDNAARGVLAL